MNIADGSNNPERGYSLTEFSLESPSEWVPTLPHYRRKFHLQLLDKFSYLDYSPSPEEASYDFWRNGYIL